MRAMIDRFAPRKEEILVLILLSSFERHSLFRSTWSCSFVLKVSWLKVYGNDKTQLNRTSSWKLKCCELMMRELLSAGKFADSIICDTVNSYLNTQVTPENYQNTVTTGNC